MDFIFNALRLAAVAGSHTTVTIHEQGPANLNTMRDRITRLEEDNAKLAAICSALWAVVKEKTGASDEQLIEQIRNTAPRAGLVDNVAVQAKKVRCPSCGAVLTAAVGSKCQFCGWEVMEIGKVSGP